MVWAEVLVGTRFTTYAIDSPTRAIVLNLFAADRPEETSALVVMASTARTSKDTDYDG